MARFTRLVIWLTILATVVCAVSGAATQSLARWAITDLGTLPGDKYSEAVAVNDRGQVVGVSYAQYVGRGQHAVLGRTGRR
jgi:uncharacterized membrane protein